MSIAARYLNRELVGIFAVTLAMLLLVAVGGRFIGYLQEAAMGRFTGATVLTIMYMRLPEFVQLVTPFALFIAILITLGRLHADHEMVVLQGGGAGTWRVIKWLSISAIVIIACVVLLAVYLTPAANHALSEFLTKQRNATEFETVNPGAFHTYYGGRRVTYSEAMSDDRTMLYGVFMSQRDLNGNDVSIWAESGTQYVDEASGSHFLVLNNGRRYESIPGQPNLRMMEFAQLRQRLSAEDDDPNDLDIEAQPISSLGSDPEPAAEFHWRIGLGLFCLIGALLAVGMSRVKPRQGRFARIMPGMLVMLLYYLALLLNRNAIVEAQLPSWMGLWFVHLAFAGLAAWQLSRLRQPVNA
jgi:lipopolysaccharide export system permease protein